MCVYRYICITTNGLNLPKEEYGALKDLSKRNAIVIKPPAKSGRQLLSGDQNLMMS